MPELQTETVRAVNVRVGDILEGVSQNDGVVTDRKYGRVNITLFTGTHKAYYGLPTVELMVHRMVPTTDEKFVELEETLHVRIDSLVKDAEDVKTPLELFEKALTTKDGTLSGWLQWYHVDSLLESWARQQEMRAFALIVSNSRSRDESIITTAERLVKYQKKLAKEVLETTPSHSTSQMSNLMDAAIANVKRELSGHGSFRHTEIDYLVRAWHRLASQNA